MAPFVEREGGRKGEVVGGRATAAFVLGSRRKKGGAVRPVMIDKKKGRARRARPPRRRRERKRKGGRGSAKGFIPRSARETPIVKRGRMRIFISK